ncbi:MAG: pyruvate, phosphate dikinase [Bacteroidales bacterium]|nr:MAG: pyruvate, phosphate dikinase [Bacteroidales bacterium]
MKGITEHINESNIINQTLDILNSNLSVEETLQEICNILPKAWPNSEYFSARITFNSKIFKTNNLDGASLICKQSLEIPSIKNGTIELFANSKYPGLDDSEFLKESTRILKNITLLTAGSISKKILKEVLTDKKERLKELHAINQTNIIISKGKSVNETLQEICDFLSKSWQYPRYAAARIKYEGETYRTKPFKETKWYQNENFVTIDNKKGSVEIFYLKELPRATEGPFLKEERQLLKNIARLISGYLNNIKGRDLISKRHYKDEDRQKSDEYRQSLEKTKQPLQLFFNRQIIDKYIYLDMMKYKVKEILFVATLYDAFILENEDSFFEQFMGEIYQYSLFSLPRITGVSSSEEALELLETTRFDLVILMVGMDMESPVKLSKKIKQKQPELPVYLLLNQQSNIKYFEELIPNTKSIDKMFIWNGDSQIFFAIVKSIEDSVNVENDTKVGLVRVILLIENSAQYYSKYLSMLYSIVFGQIQQLISEVEKNELDKISKMRSRPKILLAGNYEEALHLFHKYKDFMLCVISDVEFEKDGSLNKKAGIEFIRYVKKQISNLPTLLQSSDIKNAKIAVQLDSSFINKNSESLSIDLKKFLTYHLGFGDFIFRDREGKKVAVAKTFKEMVDMMDKVPDESLVFHAEKNQFSIWLMARGEIQLAKTLNPIKLSDFKDINEFRSFNTSTIREYWEERKRGRVINFEESDIIDEKNIVTLSGGSLGGKGRGLAFINTLIYNLDFSEHTKEIIIRTPKTAIIGTDEFELFLERNHLHDKIFNSGIKYRAIRELFTKSKLSPELVTKLKKFIDQINKPIAVRSSSISEDSLTQPFAGIFDTYIIPNNHPDKKVRLENLITTIKLVYASIYSDKARKYFQAINHKIEDDRMAVILQELVGNQYDNYYYPHISGIAQSYNFYPYEHMKPEEGFAIAALGLGSYVVEGGKAYRFSPKYPNLEILSPEDLLKSTQLNYYSLNLTMSDIDYLKHGEKASLSLLNINEAKKHGTLNHCASVYNRNNDIIEPGVKSNGPIIVNFADILKYNYTPLAKTIRVMLDSIKDSLGSPVEIEFAVDLGKQNNELATFYLLQIKPLVGNQLNYDINLDEIDKSTAVLFSSLSLGNGIIEEIYDVVYVDINKFNKMKTMEMAVEIENINEKMIRQNRKYILMGQGRWGSRDRHLGIPVCWSQISNAKVIVEISLSDFPIDASLGSHFFHNITSMNIGYLSVLDTTQTDFVRWDILNQQKIIEKTNYLRHVRFGKPLTVFMDGREKISVIVTK